MTRPSVTALVITYNQERFVETALRSALTQDNCDLQVVLVDDGSSDETLAVARRTAVDSRIEIIELTHRGVGKLGETYNTGLAAANGDYIAILEGDDVWVENRLAQQVRDMENCSAVLSYGIATRIDDQGVEGTSWRMDPALANRPLDAMPMLLRGNPIPAVTAVCRRDALVAVGGFRQIDETPIVDFPTWLELSLVGPFLPINRKLGYWRHHPGSQSIARNIELGASGLVAVRELQRRMGAQRDPNPDIFDREVLGHLLRFCALAGDAGAWRLAGEGLNLADAFVQATPGIWPTSTRLKRALVRVSIMAGIPIPMGYSGRAEARRAWQNMSDGDREAMLSLVRRLLLPPSER